MYKELDSVSQQDTSVLPVKLGKEDDLEEIRQLVNSAKLSTEHIGSTSKWYLVRNRDGSLAACMGLEPRDEYVYIQSLVVDRTFRRHGLARKLTEQAYENDLKPGQVLIALTLFWNKRIYEKLGFSMLDAAYIKSRDDVGSRPKHKYCMALGRFR